MAAKFLALLCAALAWGAPAQQVRAEGGVGAILQSWQGDFPTARLDTLPDGQRDAPAGFINDAARFGVELPKEAPPNCQEQAYTSRIWYPPCGRSGGEVAWPDHCMRSTVPQVAKRERRER